MGQHSEWRGVSRRLIYSKKWRRCDDAARVLWLAMQLGCDSYGVLEADPEQIKAECLPDMPGWTARKVATALAKLAAVKLVQAYAAEGRKWVQLVDFDTHQHPEFRRKRGKARNPLPPAATEIPANTQGGLQRPEAGPKDTETDTVLTPTSVGVLSETAAPAALRTPSAVAADMDRCRAVCGETVASMVDDLVALMAAENTTGRVAARRAHRELWQPIAEMVTEMGEQHVAAGCQAALAGAAPNANYVKKAAASSQKRRSTPHTHHVGPRTSTMDAYTQPVGAPA